MTTDHLLIAAAVMLIAIVILAIDLDFLIRRSYFKARSGHRALIATGTLYHYALLEHLVPVGDPGRVTVAVSEANHSIGVGAGIF